MRFILLFIILISSYYTYSQKISEISIGANFFETKSYGNNPFTIASLMRDPLSYTNYISSFQHDAWGGTGGFYSLQKNISLGASFKLNGNERWKRKLLFQTALTIGLQESHSTGSLSKRYFLDPTPGISQRIFEELLVSETRNYLGMSLGALYIFNENKKVSFFAGIQYLHQFSVVHSYTSSVQKLTFTSLNGNPETMQTSTYDQNRYWKGKTYSNSRLFVPFGLQFKVANNYILRPTLHLGIFLPPKPFRVIDESHGFGIHFIKKL